MIIHYTIRDKLDYFDFFIFVNYHLLYNFLARLIQAVTHLIKTKFTSCYIKKTCI